MNRVLIHMPLTFDACKKAEAVKDEKSFLINFIRGKRKHFRLIEIIANSTTVNLHLRYSIRSLCTMWNRQHIQTFLNMQIPFLPGLLIDSIIVIQPISDIRIARNLKTQDILSDGMNMSVRNKEKVLFLSLNIISAKYAAQQKRP